MEATIKALSFIDNLLNESKIAVLGCGTGGYITVTNLTWFTNESPSEIEKYFLNAIPEIGTMGHNISTLLKAGYSPVTAFALSENCWTYNYIDPQEAVNEMFLNKYSGDKTVEAFISNMRYEAELYSKYKQYYGYAFYIGKNQNIARL